MLRLAFLDGRVVLVIGAMIGLMAAGEREAIGAVAGLLAAGTGAMELHGANLLRDRDPRGVTWLVRSQLALLVVALGFCAARLGNFDVIQEQFVITPDIERTFRDAGMATDEILPMLRKVYFATYLFGGTIALVYKLGMARFYHQRREQVTRDLGYPAGS